MQITLSKALRLLKLNEVEATAVVETWSNMWRAS
jgi:hypothetical protein